MKKLLRSTDGVLAQVLLTCEDPVILDLRKERDEGLHYFYKSDYKWYKELTNKGETIVVLHSQDKGAERVQDVLRLADKFEREIVLIYDDIKHCEVIEGMIKHERKRIGSI